MIQLTALIATTSPQITHPRSITIDIGASRSNPRATASIDFQPNGKTGCRERSEAKGAEEGGRVAVGVSTKTA